MSGCECKRDSAQPGSSFFVEGKNRISRKIKSVAGVSRVPRNIQNNARRSNTVAGNLNLQPNGGRSAGNSKTQPEQLKSSAENELCPAKIQIAGWRANAFAGDLNCRVKIQLFIGPSMAFGEN